jgi:hypothetical protein
MHSISPTAHLASHPEAWASTQSNVTWYSWWVLWHRRFVCWFLRLYPANLHRTIVPDSSSTFLVISWLRWLVAGLSPRRPGFDRIITPTLHVHISFIYRWRYIILQIYSVVKRSTLSLSLSLKRATALTINRSSVFTCIVTASSLTWCLANHSESRKNRAVKIKVIHIFLSNNFLGTLNNQIQNMSINIHKKFVRLAVFLPSCRKKGYLLCKVC